jgi:hypothetical protein
MRQMAEGDGDAGPQATNGLGAEVYGGKAKLQGWVNLASCGVQLAS